MKKMIMLLCSTTLLLLLLTACSNSGGTRESTGTPESSSNSAESSSGTLENTSDAAENTSGVSQNPDDTTESSSGIKATLYLPDNNADNFITTEVTLSDDSPQSLIDALIDHGALPQGVRVIADFDRTAEIPVLDLSREFTDLLRTYGTTGESMLIGSTVNTFLTCYDLDSIYIYCEGEVLESGHEIYSYPLEMYDD